MRGLIALPPCNYGASEWDTSTIALQKPTLESQSLGLNIRSVGLVNLTRFHLLLCHFRKG